MDKSTRNFVWRILAMHGVLLLLVIVTVYLAAREHPSFGYELDHQECRVRARTA